MEFLNAIIGALIGSASAAIFTLLYGLWDQKRKSCLETTINLYREYQTNSMNACRIRAIRLMKKNLVDQRLSYMELYKQLPLEEWLDISSFLHFFEQLSVYYKVKYLDKKLAIELFSESFSYYYDNYLNELNRISNAKEHSDEFVRAIEDIVCWLYRPSKKPRA